MDFDEKRIQQIMEERNIEGGHLSQEAKQDIADLIFKSYLDVYDIMELCPLGHEEIHNISCQLFYNLVHRNVPEVLDRYDVVKKEKATVKRKKKN